MTFIPILALALIGNICELLTGLVKGRQEKKLVPYRGIFNHISEETEPLF